MSAIADDDLSPRYCRQDDVVDVIYIYIHDSCAIDLVLIDLNFLINRPY